jgi:DNA-binding response OmpR family regulator
MTNWLDDDVILLGGRLQMDGITACRLLRKRIATAILAAGYVFDRQNRSGRHYQVFDAGGTDYATKPFNRYEVLRTVTLGRAALDGSPLP